MTFKDHNVVPPSEVSGLDYEERPLRDPAGDAIPAAAANGDDPVIAAGLREARSRVASVRRPASPVGGR